jgi:hypothetical protein
MKKLFKLLVILIVLLIGAAVAAYIYLDTIAKAAIQRGSTYALGVDTTLNSVHLQPFAGELSLNSLEVANPKGYQTNHFLTLKDGDVAVTLSSLTSDLVEVPRIRLADIDMNLEKKDGKANYQVILDNLKGSETQPAPKTEEQGKRYMVRELSVKNVTVHVDALGPLGKVNVPIDNIELRNIGSDTGKGVLLKDLSGVIVKAIFAAIAEKAGGLIPDDIAGDLKNGLAQLTDITKIADVQKLGDVVKDVSKPIEDITKSVGDVGKKAGHEIDKTVKGLGGLLGGDK